ncbi:MAG TPA: hypothetical protein VNG51_20330 [Ktedonobacteraceae bacterium]|nr:hypothetical protein [Ktedonobacteraceae bacterium]
MSETSTTVRMVRPRLFRIPRFFSLGNTIDTQPLGDNAETVKIGRKSSPPLAANAPDDNTITLRRSKNNVSAVVDESTIPLEPGSHAAHASLTEVDDDTFIKQGSNWHKVLEARPLRPTPTPRPKEETLTGQRMTPAPLYKKVRSIPPALFFWISMLLIAAIVMGGFFGIFATFGRGTQPQNTQMTLQVTPTTVVLGATITLHGSYFTPHGHIGLSRDASIPMQDTSGRSIISANASGSFTDTVLVTPNWQAGSHLIHAEDATLHKTASFTIIATGQSPSQRPPHLLLSTGSLDFGSGDQATNSFRQITLSNSGGGQVTWQTATTQSWLMLSPTSGTFSAGQTQKVMVAVDRANLKPGAYGAKVIFTASTGQYTLPVTMKTGLLVPGNASVLQLTPPLLAFSGGDGAASPPAQVVTVSNPGTQPLQWSATTNGGNGWLTVSPTFGSLAVGNSQSVIIGVNTSTLLPGFYDGWVNFTGVGTPTTKDSPQGVYFSLTIVPQCSLQVSPGNLSFAGVYQQPGPATKLVSLTTTQECTSPIRWNASATTANGGSWLSIGTTSGTTPEHAAIAVSTTGLTPGIYTGTIIFNSKPGTQTLFVSLILAQATTPLMSASPTTLSFSTVAGQTNPSTQTLTVSNTGGGTLSWQASATTSIGGTWLTIAPTNGTLSGNQSAPISVSAAWLSGLTPGTYMGTITISGTDSSGHTASGSPQTIPVSFTVQPPCTIAVTPAALSFTGVVGQPNPPTQNARINASGTCLHTLTWTASTSSAWLAVSPTTGSLHLNSSATTSIGVLLAGLHPQTYSGTVTITATDSVNGQQIGTPQTVAVTLTVQPPCSLQVPSPSAETFNAEAGINPATQTFTIGITGSCTGNVTLTATATGGSWLAVSPGSVNITQGSTTFTVTVTSSSLAPGQYSGTISIAAVDSGISIVNSPQTVAIMLNVLAPPVLAVSPASLTFNVTTGINTLPFTIANTGGEPLNWTAALDPGAPSFVSLSASSGNGLAGDTNSAVNVIVDATGLSGGSTYNTSVTVSAIDPLTGNTVSGSPATVTITINVAPFSMKLDTDSLSFTTTAGVNPPPQIITLTNSGGDGSWSAGSPSQSWVSLSPTSGTIPSGSSELVTFSVDVTGMSSGSYSASVMITSSGGNATTVNIALTIN